MLVWQGKPYEAAAIRNTVCYCVSEQDMSLLINFLLICDTSVPNSVHVWAHGHVAFSAASDVSLRVCLPFSDSVAVYLHLVSHLCVPADAQCTLVMKNKFSLHQ